jgi:hypothetical protein
MRAVGVEAFWWHLLFVVVATAWAALAAVVDWHPGEGQGLATGLVTPIILALSGVHLGLAAAPPWRTSTPGACLACGYDLAGLPRGLACPECGATGGPARPGKEAPARTRDVVPIMVGAIATWFLLELSWSRMHDLEEAVRPLVTLPIIASLTCVITFVRARVVARRRA